MITAIIFIFGIIFGSFITMLSYRLPREENIISEPSYCINCNAPLKPLDLIPLFSWVLSLGKCRHCGFPVSIRYPLTELATGLIFVLIYFQKGLSYEGALLALLSIALITITIVDLEHRIIPDSMQIYCLFLAIVYIFLNEGFIHNIIGAGIGLALGFTLYYGSIWILKKEGIGFGDIKFLGVAGLWIGSVNFLPFITYGGMLGIITGIFWQIFNKNKQFPFAPSLAVSMFVCLLYPEVANWYWQGIGKFISLIHYS